MTVYFWILTACLFIGAMVFVFPWLRWSRMMMVVFFAMGCTAYLIYATLGSSGELHNYYTAEQDVKRQQRTRMQPLLTELKKQEYRLRFYLEEYPNDALAHSQLFEILGIQALQVGNIELAKHCFLEALSKMANNKISMETSIGAEYKKRVKHLEVLIKSL